MTDRPIIFSAPMVRALLDGRKTQTRRILKPPKWSTGDQDMEFSGDSLCAIASQTGCFANVPIPYAPSDRLWVREVFYQFGHWEPVATKRTRTGRQKWRFVADTPSFVFDLPERGPVRLGRHHKDPETPAWHKRLGRFMPRRASRLTLIVEGVRVERLQEISEADARAEGMIFTDFGVYQPQGEVSIDGGRSFHALKPRQHPGWHSGQATDPADCLHSARSAFGNLWNTLHGPDAWAANPWVAAISFRVVKANIDAIANSPICEEVA